MGAWEYGPFENDAALDWFDTRIRVPTVRALRAALPRKAHEGDYAEARAAAQVVIALGPLFGEDELGLAVDTIEKMAADDAWIASWEKPTALRQSLREQWTELKTLLRAARARETRRERSVG